MPLMSRKHVVMADYDLPIPWPSHPGPPPAETTLTHIITFGGPSDEPESTFPNLTETCDHGKSAEHGRNIATAAASSKIGAPPYA